MFNHAIRFETGVNLGTQYAINIMKCHKYYEWRIMRAPSQPRYQNRDDSEPWRKHFEWRVVRVNGVKPAVYIYITDTVAAKINIISCKTAHWWDLVRQTYPLRSLCNNAFSLQVMSCSGRLFITACITRLIRFTCSFQLPSGHALIGTKCK
jgi:hypothetical protein